MMGAMDWTAAHEPPALSRAHDRNPQREAAPAGGRYCIGRSSRNKNETSCCLPLLFLLRRGTLSSTTSEEARSPRASSAISVARCRHVIDWHVIVSINSVHTHVPQSNREQGGGGRAALDRLIGRLGSGIDSIRSGCGRGLGRPPPPFSKGKCVCIFVCKYVSIETHADRWMDRSIGWWTSRLLRRTN